MGEIEDEDGVLVLKRIHVTYRLRADDSRRDEIDRALRVHERGCPVARSLGGCIAISTELELV